MSRQTFSEYAPNEMRNEIEYSQHWQAQTRGTNDEEYQIYVDCAESLGWDIKTYDEWLNS